MTRNYKYKLYASKHSKELSMLVTSANFVWNHIVTLSRRYYRMYKKSLSPVKLQKHMVKIYRNNHFWSKFHTHSLQNICQKYEEALNQAFKKKRGFPRTHKPHNNGSVLFKGSGGYKLYDNGKHGILVINKLGRNWRFKFKVTRPWGEVKNIIVKRDCDGCLYLTVCCEVPEKRLERENSGPIGMDFGMKTFLTLSNGERIDIPDYHKQSLKETRKADRNYSNKLNAKVYGTSFRMAKKTRQKAHRKVANRRSDFHWKLAHQLCKRFSFIAIEDLNIKGMQRHKRWGRKISSLGYSEFVKKLEVVAVKYGTEVKKIGRYEASSKTCSECGHKDGITKDLKVREWTCPECGSVHDRDVNAAKNILRFGVAENTTGKGVSPDGSRGKTSGGTPSVGSGDGHVSCPAPSENPMTSVVGVRQGKRTTVMDTHDLDNSGCDVPESFKTICNLIRKQVITYDEAWDIMKDLIGNKENNMTPYHFPFNPFPDIKPYRGKGKTCPYFDDCMDKKYTHHRDGLDKNNNIVFSSDNPNKSNYIEWMHQGGASTDGCSSSSYKLDGNLFSSSATDINSEWNKYCTPTSEFNNPERK